MVSRHWYDLRVFTRDGDGGNPLAVVPDAVDIPTESMQRGATEIGYSETVYLNWNDGAAHPRVRIFTPGVEMTFAGHPLVGTVWLMANVGPAPDIAHIEPPVGVLACGADPDGAYIECPLPPVFAVEGGHVAGLGRPYRLEEFGSAEAVEQYRPDLPRIAASGNELAVFALEGTTARMRFFAPQGGVDEDPATGSAAVSLASLLHSVGRLVVGEDLEILQGDNLGRPSRLLVSITEGGKARLSGTVAFDGIRHFST